jgi:hypothetical protein
MDVYKAEVDELLRRFLLGRLTREQCLAGLYEAIGGVLPYLRAEDLPELRECVRNQGEAIRNEAARRAAERRELSEALLIRAGV